MIHRLLAKPLLIVRPSEDSHQPRLVLLHVGPDLRHCLRPHVRADGALVLFVKPSNDSESQGIQLQCLEKAFVLVRRPVPLGHLALL